MSELNLEGNTKVEFPFGKEDLMRFRIIINPMSGMYEKGSYVFNFEIGAGYPHDAPKVKCLTKVYHPNIDLQGNICLNILREDWKPVLSINSIIYGLQVPTSPRPTPPLDELQSRHRNATLPVGRSSMPCG